MKNYQRLKDLRKDNEKKVACFIPKVKQATEKFNTRIIKRTKAGAMKHTT